MWILVETFKILKTLSTKKICIPSGLPHSYKDVYISEAHQQPSQKHPTYQYPGRAAAWSQNNGPAQPANNWNQQSKPTISYKGRNSNLNSGPSQPHMNQKTPNWIPPNHPSTGNHHSNLAPYSVPMNPGMVPFIDPDLPDGLDDLWEMQQKQSAIQHMMNSNPSLTQQMMSMPKNMMPNNIQSQGQQQGPVKKPSGPGNVRIYTNPNTGQSNGLQWNHHNTNSMPQGANYEQHQMERIPNPAYRIPVNGNNGTQTGETRITHLDLRDNSQPKAIAFRNQWYRKRGRQNQESTTLKPTATTTPSQTPQSRWNQQQQPINSNQQQPQNANYLQRHNTNYQQQPSSNLQQQQNTYYQQNPSQQYMGRSHFATTPFPVYNKENLQESNPNIQHGMNAYNLYQPNHQFFPYQQPNPSQGQSQYMQPNNSGSQRKSDEDQMQFHHGGQQYAMYQNVQQGNNGGTPMGWNQRRPDLSEYNEQDDQKSPNVGQPSQQPENENEGQYKTRPNIAPGQYYKNQQQHVGQRMPLNSFWPSNGPGQLQGNQPQLGNNGPYSGRFNGNQPYIRPPHRNQGGESEQEIEGQRPFSMTNQNTGNTRISDRMLQELLNERLKQRGIGHQSTGPWSPVHEGGYGYQPGHINPQLQNTNNPKMATGPNNQKPNNQKGPSKGNSQKGGKIPSITGREVWVDPKNQQEIAASRMKPNVLDEILDQFLLGGADEIDTPYGKIERENNGGYEVEGPLLRMILAEIRNGKINKTKNASPYDLEHQRKFAGFNPMSRTPAKQRDINPIQQGGRNLMNQRKNADSQSSQEVSPSISMDPDQPILDSMKKAIWESLPINSNTNEQSKLQQSVNTTKVETASNPGNMELTTRKPETTIIGTTRQPNSWIQPQQTQRKPDLWQNPRMQNIKLSPWDPIGPEAQGRQPWNPSQTGQMNNQGFLPEGSGAGDNIQFPQNQQIATMQNITQPTPINGSSSIGSFNMTQIIHTPNEDPYQIKEPPPMAARIVQLPDDSSTTPKAANTSQRTQAVPKTAVERKASGSAFGVIIITLVVMGCLIAPAACIVWRIRKKKNDQKRKNIKADSCCNVKLETDAMVLHDFGNCDIDLEKSQGARRKTYFKDFSDKGHNVHELQPLKSSDKTPANVHKAMVHQVNEVF